MALWSLSLTPLQTRLATLGLQALANHQFVLAGGYALRAHGFGNRESDDIDRFTNDLDLTHFTEAVDQLRQHPPVLMDLGAVLSEADAVGSKVGAIYSRLEARDFIDVQADVTEYLNRDVLVALWPRLRLPRRCAALWLQAFPQLAAGDS
ncbi:putative nucleotidyltransferase component of viral defense system [Kribbella aluminosa]|uniref:Nucleotidyltransferase component of viral defense system n=1 Tax=Kribbella aluminosa TaxID=416017 RepID=A0ABS4UF53_9ACTN|nr:hypothetical protein [Kribbella aluminosa]MBP2350201.1 putative nucleotidyltransferase component of viral defense system [Kribbella aluminosa]